MEVTSNEDDEDLVRRSRRLLAELRGAVAQLPIHDPLTFERQTLTESLSSVFAAIDRAGLLMRKPTLRISTMAVTSAGKSTLVNALTGRQLAPTDRGEISAGALRIRHAPTMKLVVTSTRGATWKTGEFVAMESADGAQIPLDDEFINKTLKDVMRAYYQACEDGSPAMPAVQVEAPLLPILDPSLLDLPPTVALELVDLPGHKSFNQDHDNLRFVIDAARETFGVMVLDYNDVTDRVDMIVARMKDTIMGVKGDGQDVLFVLNKYLSRDDANSDAEYDAFLGDTARRIRATLGLADDPPLVLLEARLWMYGQLLWGCAPLTGAPVASLEQRTRAMGWLLRHYEGHIRAFVDRDAGLSAWWRGVKERTSSLTEDELRTLITKIVLPLSGANGFMGAIRARVRSRLGALLIRPVVRQAIGEAEKLLGTISAISEIRGQTSEVARQAVATELTAKVGRLTAELQGEASKVRDVLKALTCLLEISSTPSVSSGSQQQPGEDDRRKAKMFRDAVSDLGDSQQVRTARFWALIDRLRIDCRADFETKVVNPLRRLRKAGGTVEGIGTTIEDASELIALLETALPRVRSVALANTFDDYLDEVAGLDRVGDYLHLKFSRGASYGLNAYDRIVKAQAKLYEQLQHAVLERTSMFVVGRAREVEEFLKSYLLELSEEIPRIAVREELNGSVLMALMQGWFTEEFVQDLALPESVSSFDISNKERVTKQWEVVGTRTVTKRPWYLLWLVEVEKEEPVYDQREYDVREVPSMHRIASETIDAQDGAIGDFVTRFVAWAGTVFESWSERVSATGMDMLAQIESEIDSHKTLALREVEERVSRWTVVKQDAVALADTLGELKELC